DGFAQLVATRVDSPRFNSQLPEDVNGNNEVTAVDALQIINDLNARQSSEIGFDESDGPSVDVTNDGRVTALDALLVINYLNSQDAHRSAPEPVDNGSLEASSDVVFAQNPSFIASSSDDEIDGISVDRSDPLQLI
ncbi:MAG: dockerin type I domain-containing protein, partial [Planctomycetota bacterium]